MSAPRGFTLQPINTGLHLPPTAPTHLKSEIYNDQAVFKAIDNHAIQVASMNYASFRDLMWNLVYKRNLSELEKARVIFRWMTCRDLLSLEFADEKPGTPEQLLSAFKAKKVTYARIFECLTRHAGLSCVTIVGWAKGVDYRPGVPITSQPINHSWNAVYVDGNWQLVDCHWATRFLQSERNVPENLIYEYDDFYFLPEPSQLAYTHYPEDNAWLLTDTPVSKDNYEDVPLVKSFLFVTGMHLLPKQNHGVVYTKRGVTTISVGFTTQMTFTFKLVYGDDMLETLNNVDFDSFVVQETKDESATYYIRLPKNGDYYLIVFAHPTNEADSTSESVFKAVCEFKVVGDDVPEGEIVPFPRCSDANWGPDTFMSRYGLGAKNRVAILDAPDGNVEVGFSKSREVKLYAQLIKDGVDPATLKRAVAVKKDDGQVTFVLNLPEEGEYGMEIYANDPQKEGDMFTHVCQYLVHYTKHDLTDVYGEVSYELPVRNETDGRKRGPSNENWYRPATKNSDSGDNDSDIDDNSPYPFGVSAEPRRESIVPLDLPVVPTEEYKPHSAEIYTNTIDETPESFETVPIESEEPPVPDVSMLSTHKPFIDTTVFKDVDTHAAEVSKKEHRSFRDIMWHLIYARKITNDLDRARAIFLWLCSKDLSKLDFEDCAKGSPEESLMSLQRGQTTYARVYETLCSHANLHAKTLTGYAKGADYKPGMQFAGQQAQHSWNAVLIKGTWQLVDCHWAARRVVGKKITSDNVRYELDEYYFMPAPSQLIFSHFPEDPSWQLLERNLTLDEFEKLVPVKPTFFKCGLQLVSHTDAVVGCTNETTIRIECPLKRAKALRFTFNMTHEDGGDTYRDIKLNRFAMQEVVGNICYLTVRPPELASYLVVLYAKDLDNQAKKKKVPTATLR